MRLCKAWQRQGQKACKPADNRYLVYHQYSQCGAQTRGVHPRVEAAIYSIHDLLLPDPIHLRQDVLTEDTQVLNWMLRIVQHQGDTYFICQF